MISYSCQMRAEEQCQTIARTQICTDEKERWGGCRCGSLHCPSVWILTCMTESVLWSVTPQVAKTHFHKGIKKDILKTKHNCPQRLKEHTDGRWGISATENLKDFYIYQFLTLIFQMTAHRKQLRSSNRRLWHSGIKLSPLKVISTNILF